MSVTHCKERYGVSPSAPFREGVSRPVTSDLLAVLNQHVYTNSITRCDSHVLNLSITWVNDDYVVNEDLVGLFSLLILLPILSPKCLKIFSSDVCVRWVNDEVNQLVCTAFLILLPILSPKIFSSDVQCL